MSDTSDIPFDESENISPLDEKQTKKVSFVLCLVTEIHPGGDTTLRSWVKDLLNCLENPTKIF